MRNFVRTFLSLCTLALLATSSIVTGCGSGSTPTPAATCSAISIPGFYAAWNISATGENATFDNLIKELGVMAYFQLNSDNTFTIQQYSPNSDYTVKEAQSNAGGGYNHKTFTGTWSNSNNDITLISTENGSSNIFTGTLSQTNYPDCIASFAINGSVTFKNGQNQEVLLTETITAYQYPEGFDANNITGSYTVEDSRVMLNNDPFVDATGTLPIGTSQTITATSAEGGTISSSDGEQSASGTFTFNNPSLLLNLQTNNRNLTMTEYIAVNPVTGEYISILYGVVDTQDEVATLYLQSKKQ